MWRLNNRHSLHTVPYPLCQERVKVLRLNNCYILATCHIYEACCNMFAINALGCGA